jgi:hypothetical protein
MMWRNQTSSITQNVFNNYYINTLKTHFCICGQTSNNMIKILLTKRNISIIHDNKLQKRRVFAYQKSPIRTITVLMINYLNSNCQCTCRKTQQRYRKVRKEILSKCYTSRSVSTLSCIWNWVLNSEVDKIDAVL